MWFGLVVSGVCLMKKSKGLRQKVLTSARSRLIVGIERNMPDMAGQEPTIHNLLNAESIIGIAAPSWCSGPDPHIPMIDFVFKGLVMVCGYLYLNRATQI